MYAVMQEDVDVIGVTPVYAANTWVGFLAKEKILVWALLTRRIRMRGSPKLLVAFGKCFPS